MTYSEAFIEAISNKELVNQYDRLFNCHLGKIISSLKKQDINFKIDLATGHFKQEVEKFKDFFNKYILTQALLQELKPIPKTKD